MTDISVLPGHLIRRLQQIAVAVFTSRMAEAGLDLTPVQFGAMATLELHPRIDQATLAGLVAYDRVTLGGVVDRLVAKGFLTRTVSPSDRRARVIDLTPDGRAVLERARPAVALVQDDILQGLARDERETFMRLLTKATEAGNELSRAPLRTVDEG
ncbi:MarR family transcriptional regulator [Pseudoxanthobacter sp.]|uniref:MarR family winged helix-turn-helix transcriptional regulator n=1 Tax=Pseudoxanthobacter sp. TaxID=1925742 RepID=UPI002FE3C106